MWGKAKVDVGEGWRPRLCQIGAARGGPTSFGYSCLVVTTRTYHPRQGRVSARHRAALTDLWPLYGVTTPGPLDATALFGRALPLVLEIGSGMGEATAAMAAADPGRGYLAVEIHRPGIANLLRLVHDRGLANLRVHHGDALDLLRDDFAQRSLDAIHAFFPDPWPKTRHHKRRLIEPDRVGLLSSRLRAGGTLHCATDDVGYARAMLETLSASPDLANTADSFASRPEHRPVTKFERQAIQAGRPIFDLVFQRAETRQRAEAAQRAETRQRAEAAQRAETRQREARQPSGVPDRTEGVHSTGFDHVVG
jgi:tRNA (guanine-N7-)-methyltransferase